MSWTDLLTTISTVACVAVVFVYRAQLRVMRQQVDGVRQQIEAIQRQIRDDHERSRREEALRIMKFWAERVDALPVTLANATKLCRSLEREKRMALLENLPFHLQARRQR